MWARMPTVQLLALLALQAICQAQSADRTPPSLSDATLRAVTFMNDREAVAVGDRGTILRTEDAGATWQRIPSWTVCNLNGVFFRDERYGWAVGGQAIPHVPDTNGLVLLTSDGGRSWRPIAWGATSRLYGIFMVSTMDGICWGEASTTHPGGWYRTQRGGTQWKHLSAEGAETWLAGDFDPDGSGLLGGSNGTMLLVQGNQATPLPAAAANRRAIHAVHFSRRSYCWAVGENGLILRGEPGGVNWTAIVPENLPDPTAYDWLGLHAEGESVWLCGAPGDIILVSRDGGKTWHASPTGGTVPLFDVTFRGETGVAVGALGTLLRSEDGGQSWQQLAGHPPRAAVLFLQPVSERAHFPLFSFVGSGLGLTCSLATIHRVDRPVHDRLADALVQCGVSGISTGRALPPAVGATDPEGVLRLWQRYTERGATEDLDREINRLIRIWQPQVVVVCDSLEGAYGPLLVDSVTRVVRALRQSDTRGPVRLYAVSRRGTIHVPEAAPATTEKNTTAVLAATALSLYDDGSGESENSVAPLTLVWANDERADLAGAGLWVGLASSRQLRRPAVSLSPEQTEQLRRAAAAYERAVALVGAAGQGHSPTLVSNVDELTEDLSEEQAGFLLAEIARRFCERGQWWEAEQAYGRLIANYPRHLETATAWRWFVQFYGSEEMQVWLSRRERTVHRKLVPILEAAFTRPLLPDKPGALPEPVQVEITSSEIEAATGAVVPEVWQKMARAAYQRLLRISPRFAAAPSVMLPYASLARRTGDAATARTYYAALALRGRDHRWASVGDQEKWLIRRDGRPRRNPTLVHWGPVPRLDGRVDDPLWQQARWYRVETQHGLRSGYSTAVAIATDGRFLFLAIQAEHPEQRPVKPARHRRRDEELGDADRVLVALDVDRDYQVFYEFEVDRRGRCAERCWRSAAWNPRWYVAALDSPTRYVVECAIPLEELTLTPPGSGTAWAINVYRIVPGAHVGALNGPLGGRSSARPESFSLAIFGRR